jgi:hypothetical protein
MTRTTPTSHIPAVLPALLLAGVSLGAAACTFEPDGGGGGLAEQLRKRAFLDVSTESDVAVSAASRGGQTLDVAPGVLGGEAVLRTTEDGWLLVEDLSIPLDDVVVPPGMLADRPVTFTSISLRLGTQLAVKPLAPLDAGDVSLVGWGDADLLLDWAMLSWDGKDVLPLAMRRIADAPFAVAIELDADGALHASITARVDGVVDNLGELVILRDLSLDVVSATSAPTVLD